MTRLLFITTSAVLINLLLFTAIEYMVGSKRVRLTPAEDVQIANFIRVMEDSREVRSRRDPAAPEKPTQDMNEDLNRLADASNAGGLGTIDFNAPNLDIDIGPAVAGDIRIARELTPLVRVSPDYPPGALAKRIEGFVLLRFEVTETGSVENPEVLRAEPEGLFDRAAKRAVTRWKFQPQIRDGKPTRVVTMNRIVFMLDRSGEAEG